MFVTRQTRLCFCQPQITTTPEEHYIFRATDPFLIRRDGYSDVCADGTPETRTF